MVSLALIDPKEALATYGYLAVFVFVGIESLGVPFPGETMLLTAAIYAGTTGNLSSASLMAWAKTTLKAASSSTNRIRTWIRSSRKSLALAHPPGLLRCRRFPTHPERLDHRSHTHDEHEDRQD